MDRFKRFIPLALIMLAWLVLGGLHVLHQNDAPATRPIPPCRRAVLLVVPGLNADDWNPSLEGSGASVFEPLFVTYPFALFPVPSPLRPPQSDSLAPDARIALACKMLVGSTKDFRLKVLDSTGSVAAALDASDAVPDTWSASAPEAVGGQVTDPAKFVRAVQTALGPAAGDAASPPVVVVAVLDDMYRADTYAPLCLPRAAHQTRQNALRRVSQTISALPDMGDSSHQVAVLLVAPLPSAPGKSEKERMGFLLLREPNLADEKGAHLLLTAPSTRHTPGLVAFGDIPETLHALLSQVPRTSDGGRSIVADSISNAPSVFERQATHWAAQWRETRLLVVVPWILAGLLLASVFWSGRKKRIGAFCALLACALPVALWASALLPLATGERMGSGVAFYGFAALLAGCAATFALRKGNSASTLQAITGCTACLLVLDSVLGGPLLSRSPLSYSPLEGARFYGVGNEAAGIFLGASLAFALLCGNRTGFGARLLGGLGVTALFALPTLGADAGGAIAALAGWGTLLVLDAPPKYRKAAAGLAALCAVLLLAGLTVWESHRPASVQTHLGQVITQTQTQGAGGAISIALRKVAMNAHLSVSSPWAILFFVEGGLCIYLWRKLKTNATPVPGGIIALFVGAGAAFIANDSGVVMAATCLLFAPPLLLFLSKEVPEQV